MFQADDIRMRILDQLPHDLQLSIFKPFVLQYFLYRNHLPSFHDGSLEHNAKRSIANNSFSGVGNCLVCCGPVCIRGRNAVFVLGWCHLYLFLHHLFGDAM